MESRQNLTLFPEGRRSGRLAHRLPEVCGAKWCWKVAQGQSANRAEDGQIRLAGIGIAVWEDLKGGTAHSQYGYVSKIFGTPQISMGFQCPTNNQLKCSVWPTHMKGRWGELIFRPGDRASYTKSTLAGYASLYTPWMKKQVWEISAMEGKEGECKMIMSHMSPFFCGMTSTTGSIRSYYFVDFLVFFSTSGSFVSPVSLKVCLFEGKRGFVGRSSWPLKRGPHRESIIQASYRHSSRWSFTVSMKKTAKKRAQGKPIDEDVEYKIKSHQNPTQRTALKKWWR